MRRRQTPDTAPPARSPPAPPALQRVQFGHLRQRLRGIAHLPAHRRIGAARQQCVHPNAAPAELHRQRLRQADQPRLAGRIGRRAGKRRGVADEGGGENHRARAARQHGGDLIFGAVVGAGQVGFQHLAPFWRGECQRRPQRPQRAGVVEGDIQPAEFVDRRRRQPFGEGFIAHVARHRERPAALAPNVLHQLRQQPLTPGAQHQRSPLAGEQQRRRPADPRTGAADHRHLAVQCVHRSSSRGLKILSVKQDPAPRWPQTDM